MDRPGLREASLHQLCCDVTRPDYDRSAMRPSILHLGLGAFHRAHQVPLFERLLEQGNRDCGVISAAVRTSEIADGLEQQDGLYTLVTPGAPPQVIGAIARTLVASRDTEALLSCIADPSIRLITLTITEKGYRPDGSIPKLLAAGLAKRRRAGVSPLTILSCDNLSHNGAVARDAVLAHSAADDAAWIAAACAWPSSMVDRITPRLDPAFPAKLAQRTGVFDDFPVQAEAFSQWVVENSLLADCPPLAAGGAILADDVGAWERLKLRMLNGSHSALAYLGLNAGVWTVREAFLREDIGRQIDTLWNEVAVTLVGLDTKSYRDALAERYRSKDIVHRLEQIAEDGSVKLAQRLIPPWQERCRAGQASPAIAAVIAAWSRFVRERTATGTAIMDPQGDKLVSWLTGGSVAVLMELGADADLAPVMARELELA